MAFSKARRLGDLITANAEQFITSAHITDTAITGTDIHSTFDLTGKTVTVANASTGDNDTTAANTAFVQQEIAALVDSAPGTLNTLNELAAALGDDANFSTTVTNSIATKLSLSGGTMTGAINLSDLIASGSGGLSLQTDEGTKRLFIKDNGDVKVGNLAVGSATSAPLHVAKASADVQAVFGDNNSSIDDPSIRIIGRDSANSAIRYTFTGLDADNNFGFIGYNAGSGGFVNALTFDTSGKVGIGTSSPDGNLHILHGSTNTFTASNDSWHTMVIHNNASATTNTTGIAFEVSGNAYHENAGTGIAAVKNGTNSDYGADLVFITRPQSAVAAERMRITDAGNVGIGETNPGSRLTVGDEAHGVGIDYVGNTLPSIAGIFTSSSGMTATAYGDLNIKARSDYGGNYSIGFFTASSNNTPALRMSINASGHLTPAGNNLYDLGSTANRWRNIFTNDLNLSNEGNGGNDMDGSEGNWTIQEGETDLFIINNKNGKKYKFALEELE